MVPASLAIAGLRVEPLTDGTDYEFVDEVVGGHIPRALIPAVDKGVQETMKGGVIAGFPLTGIRVACYDGSYHPVDLQRDGIPHGGPHWPAEGLCRREPRGALSPWRTSR